MLKRLLTPLVMFFALTTFAQKKETASDPEKRTDFLLSYTVKTKDGERLGYKNRHGKVVIPAQYFSGFEPDTLYEHTFVSGKNGVQGIDRTGKVILIPFIYDNGPDYPQEGLFRFVENNKIGFADLNWKKVIPAAFDFAEPFKGGITKYTLGGHKVMDGEHWYWTGGYEEGYINQWQQRFSKVTGLKAGKREAWTKEGKHVLLNQTGKIIKVFPM
ncbi:WG repeat-containing protein [Pedobacter lusitanus]|uniref:WG repeat-containing protein n=1 Tax=Pedobacter lusitanus TaxID=1503925 RepID=UPI000B29828F|nr:WG repeat-containing protein [Pedobacter lusitanus]